MWKCPACGFENRSVIICPQCGFDESCDYTRYPTVAQIQKSVLPNRWLAAERRKHAGLEDVTAAYIQYLNAYLDALNSESDSLYLAVENKAAKEKLNRLFADSIAACHAAASAAPSLMRNFIILASDYPNAITAAEAMAHYEDAAAQFKACAELLENAKAKSAYREAKMNSFAPWAIIKTAGAMYPAGRTSSCP